MNLHNYVNYNKCTLTFEQHLYSLSLRVMSTANTVTEMLSLLDRMSFKTTEFNSLLNSPRLSDVKPFQNEAERGKDRKIIKNESFQAPKAENHSER